MRTRSIGLRPMIITRRFMLVRVAILFANRSRRWSNVWIESDLCERIAQPSLTWIGLAKFARTRERQSWSFERYSHTCQQAAARARDQTVTTANEVTVH